MSNKENLIFALETAENEKTKVVVEYVGNGMNMIVKITPEIAVFDDSESVQLFDSEKGNDCQFVIDLDGKISYDDFDDEYRITKGECAAIISFRKK